MLAESCWSLEDAMHRARLWANKAGHSVYVCDIQGMWYVCESRVDYARSVVEVKSIVDARPVTPAKEDS